MTYWISENLEISFLEAKEKIDFDNILNKKRFTVKDSALTHRQINKLGTDKLLEETRENKAGWRKFSFKELVFLNIVSEIRKYGFENWQLKELFDLFHRHQYLSDLAIGCVFGQTEIFITINFQGKVSVYDPLHYVCFSENDTHIKINLTETVNNLISKTGKTPFPVKYSLKSLVLETPTLTTKETELLNLIRNKDYSSINIKKENGEVFIVHAEKSKKSREELSPTQLLHILKEKDFQDVTLHKRNGKIVHYKVEETIKL